MSTPLENPIELGSLYLLTETIGQGATGVVYRGINKETSSLIAAKILHSHHTEDPEILTQFLQEKKLLTSLNHDAIVTVKDLVAEANTLAIITEFIDGYSLRDYLKAHSNLSPYHATLITTHILAGLEHAHEKGITHRDIKPDNILLTHTWQNANQASVKLADFGISRLITRPTDTTVPIGTPAYMPPELWTQYLYNEPGDIYETGITFYEMLAGHPPFPTTDAAYHHEHSALPKLDIPESLWHTLAAMLAKNPERRPTATQALSQLNATLSELTSLPPLPQAPQPENYTPATIIKTHGADNTSTQNTPKIDPTSPTFNIPQFAPNGSATQLHPTEHPTPIITPQKQESTSPKTRSTTWKEKKNLYIIIATLAAIALVVAAIFIFSRFSDKNDNVTPLNAEQHDTPLPSGLTISRHATWDPESNTITLVIEYATQKARLAGPFLEIIETPEHTCAQVTWQETGQELNKSSQTHISEKCAWAIQTPPIPANSTYTVTATIPYEFTAENTDTTAPGTNPLQQWLDANAQLTTLAIQNPDYHTNAYPAQRLQNIEAETPTHIPTNQTIPITIIPVWPSGPDTTNPLYHTPATGNPTQALSSITDPATPIQLMHTCGAAIQVTPDQRTATTLHPTTNCTIQIVTGNYNTTSKNITITGNDS